MQVDINNLRKQAAHSLHSVIQILNDGTMPEKAYSYQEIDGKEKLFQGDLLISTDDLEKHIDHLRTCIWGILCTYEEGNPDFKDLYEEVKETGGIAEFNPVNNKEL
jgi:hypothetical protein